MKSNKKRGKTPKKRTGKRPAKSDNTTPLEEILQITGYEHLSLVGEHATISRKLNLLLALERCYGIVSPSCRMARVDRDTYYEWCKTDPEFKRAALGMQFIKKDFAEYQLFLLASKGVPQAVIEVNKKLNRDRGYGDRMEITPGSGMSNKKFYLPDNGRDKRNITTEPLQLTPTVKEDGTIVHGTNT